MENSPGVFEKHLVIDDPAEWVALMTWYRRRQITVIELPRDADEVSAYGVMSK